MLGQGVTTVDIDDERFSALDLFLIDREKNVIFIKNKGTTAKLELSRA
jgi:hypothetical protein